MELLEVMEEIALRAQAASQPAQLQVGTVTGAEPLEITVHPQMAPLKGEVLLLTGAVTELRLTGLAHTHPGGEGSAAPGQVTVWEGGVPRTQPGDEVVLIPALSVGDRVLLLREQGGQRFVVLSRLYGEVA